MSDPEALPVDAVVEAPADSENAIDKVINKTPWWAVSTGLHVLAALVLGYLVVLSAPPGEASEVVVSTPRKLVAPVFQEEQKREPVHPVNVDSKTKSPVDIKATEISEKAETPDNEDFQQVKGLSEDFRTLKPFNSTSFNDCIGAGGGPSGRYGFRFGGRNLRGARIGDGGPKAKESEDAVLAALKWLSRHQNPDGSWGVTGYCFQCGKVNASKYPGACAPSPGHVEYDPGVTGLSLLAFFGAGYYHLSRDTHDGICFGDVVRKGMMWLTSHQDTEGCIGPRAGHYMYNHAVATYALCEAYGMTGSQLVRDPAQKAVDFLVSAQNPNRGWRYVHRSGDNDSSVTGWAVMALKAAELSGLSFPASAYEGARAWFAEVMSTAGYYQTGYTHKDSGQVYVEENRHFGNHETLTAIHVMCRLFMDKSKADPSVAGGVNLLARDLPSREALKVDYYYWYNAAMAMYQYDGPQGGQWKKFNGALLEALLPMQAVLKDGCRCGSWEPTDRWGCCGGRVYATAMNALTLEVSYRYPNVIVGR